MVLRGRFQSSSMNQVEMERGEVESGRRRRGGSVRVAIDQFGDRIHEGNNPPLKKTQKDSSKSSWTARELHQARTNIGRYKESALAAESMKAQAEIELLAAKKTVRTLSSLIEDSNSKVRAQTLGMESVKKTRGLEQQPSVGKNMEDDQQYVEVIRELELIKHELSKLKLDMTSVLEEKLRVEKEKQECESKLQAFSSSLKGLHKEIEETEEEQVLVELAEIEALKEFKEIQSRREKEAKNFSTAMDDKKKKINELVEEIESSKQVETKLAVTLSDVTLIQNELKAVKEMERKVKREEKLGSSGRDEGETSDMLRSVTEELEAAKKELAAIREEGFQFMTSMDIIRNELKHVKEETSRLKKTEQKAESSFQNLNLKLIRAKAKLEAVSAAEEKAKSIVSNLSTSLEQLKKEAEAAKKERKQISDETAAIKAEIQKAESEIVVNEEKLQDALQELESVKSSEASALENLKSLIDSAMRTRASASQHSSSIKLSKFEYEYLTGRAGEAEEIADKKVAAAEAWIEALKASEREILMKYEIAKKESNDTRMEEEKQAYREEKSLSAKRMVEGELHNWKTKREKNTETEKLQETLMRKSMRTGGNLTPSRRGKIRKPLSPAPRGTLNRSTSIAIRKKRKVVPKLAKFFRGKDHVQDD